MCGLATTVPGMITADPLEQASRCVCPLPVAGSVLVGLGPGRINVDGAEDLVQSETMAHGQDEFDDQIT